MPLGQRLLLGLLGTLCAGLLNLAFRGAKVRWGQWAVALVLSPAVVLAATALGLNSGQRTEYVFCGALVGILCVRGSRPPGPIPAFSPRAVVVLVAFASLGPAVGLASHYLRYKAGLVALGDEWEIELALADGLIASFAGCILAGLMVLSALVGNSGAAGRGPMAPVASAVPGPAPNETLQT
jgi:hypothetical protein